MDFDRRDIKEAGLRGDPQFEKEEQTTDPDAMQKRQTVKHGFCYCGRRVTEETIRRCTQCDLICCSSCNVSIRDYIFCRSCCEQAFDLDKQVYTALLLIAKDVASFADFVETTTTGEGTLVDLRIDDAAQPLIQHEYVDADEELTVLGREVLDAGRQLYDSDDIKSLMRQVDLQEAANRR